MKKSSITNHQSPTLVILPGWGGSHETWADFAVLAEPHFHDVVVIDLPCFGNEPCPNEVWGVEEYADFVKKQIIKLSNNQIPSQGGIPAKGGVILLGHSFGGAVAVHLVAKNPEIVDKLILSGAAVYRPKNYIKRGVFGLLAKLGTLVVSIIPSRDMQGSIKKMLYRFAGSPDYTDTSGIKRDIFKKIIRQDLGYLLPDIAIPTCVIHGTDDTYVPCRFGRRVSQHIPSASLVIVPKGTHGLHKKRTKEFFKAIMDFIQT